MRVSSRPPIICVCVVPKKQANPIDAQVGNRVRIRRMLIGMSQEKLGDLLGLTFQQVQKYEKGKNRVSASRLQQMANVLKVTPDFFFDGASAKPVGNTGSTEIAIIQEFISSRDGVALCKAFAKIDPETRRSIVALVKQLAIL